MTERISAQDVYAAVIDMRTRFDRLCETVQEHSTQIALLRQISGGQDSRDAERDRRVTMLDDREHNGNRRSYEQGQRLALVEDATKRQGFNWDRALNIGLAILQAVLIATVLNK